MNAPKVFLLPEPIRDAVLTYLMEQRYKDVAGGIAMLQGLKEAPAEPPSGEEMALDQSIERAALALGRVA